MIDIEFRVKGKIVKTLNFNEELVKDLKAICGVDPEDELANLMLFEVKAVIDELRQGSLQNGT